MTRGKIPPIASLSGRRVLFVMAAEPEYGPNLRRRIEPLITGVGPVEAASVVAAALSRLETTSSFPELVVSLGSAGSRLLEHAVIYQVSEVSYRDMDASAFGFVKGITPFLGLPATIEIPSRIPGIPVASLSTGANVVSGHLYENVTSDMVDMETYGVLRAAMQFNLQLVGLRGISDGRNEVSRYEHWTEYLHIIDERLASAIDRLDTALAEGRLKL